MKDLLDIAIQPPCLIQPAVPGHREMFRWVMPPNADGTVETYYLRESGEFYREIFHPLPKEVGKGRKYKRPASVSRDQLFYGLDELVKIAPEQPGWKYGDPDPLLEELVDD